MNAEQELRDRLDRCLRVTVHRFCDEKQPAIIREVAGAYLYDVHKRRLDFVRAQFANLWVRQYLESELCPKGFITDHLVDVEARWEFEHLDSFCGVAEAMCLAGRYRTCDKFIGVHPLLPGDPWHWERIPMRHKASSPWHRGLKRRMELKRQLGDARAMVGYARKWTKARFLEEYFMPKTGVVRLYDDGTPHNWNTSLPRLEVWDLIRRTGYEPSEFWREVNNPYTVKPRKPAQLELSL